MSRGFKKILAAGLYLARVVRAELALTSKGGEAYRVVWEIGGEPKHLYQWGGHEVTQGSPVFNALEVLYGGRIDLDDDRISIDSVSQAIAGRTAIVSVIHDHWRGSTILKIDNVIDASLANSSEFKDRIKNFDSFSEKRGASACPSAGGAVTSLPQAQLNAGGAITQVHQKEAVKPAPHDFDDFMFPDMPVK